jgi:pectin methylesterase-like acyl-CoA thioesterase
MRRRALLLTGVAGGLTAAGARPASAAPHHRVLHVRPGGSVQAAVEAVGGPGWTVVMHPGTYREVVTIPAHKAGLTLRADHPDITGTQAVAACGSTRAFQLPWVRSPVIPPTSTTTGPGVPSAVERHVLRNAGTGRSYGHP